MATLRRSLAIDLGTASVLVYVKGRGVVLNEPSVVAMDAFTGKILAVGSKAKKMLGRTPGNIIATRPMKDGVIADYNSTEKMLKYFIEKSIGKSLIRPDVIICVPSQITPVQKRAVLQASRKAGANRTYLIEEPLAAAIGSGIDISDPGGHMIIDIGGGTTDVAVIAMGSIVINKSISIAGDELDEAIMSYIKNKYNMLIGERTAEDIKISLSDVEDIQNTDKLFEIRGRSLINGLPMQVFVTPLDVLEALESPINEIINACYYVLDKTPPEIASDLFEKGAIMTGGGSLVKGLSQRIMDRIGIDVKVSEEAISAVVKGTGKALSWISKLESDNQSYEDARRQILEEKQRLRRSY